MKTLFLLLLLCGVRGDALNSGTMTKYLDSPKGYDTSLLCSTYQLPLRRIKDIEDCWHFNTKIGKVTLTDHRFDTHIHIKHPFVTPSAIRKVLEHQSVMYKSRKRWIFEKDNLRVVVGNDNKVVTAYYMDGR